MRCRVRESFRVVHYSIMSNHVHLIVEAGERADLTRGLTGLLTSMARRLNKLWNRHGKVFDGRYHEHVLRTPTEVQRALAYVFHNARHHGMWQRVGLPDIFSSGHFFTGWADYRGNPFIPRWLAAAETWLLRVGWSRAGPIRLAVGFT